MIEFQARNNSLDRRCWLITFIGTSLAVFGDLRNIVTPAGYWLLWGLTFFLGFDYFLRSRTLQIDKYWRLIAAGFILYVSSLFFTAITNNDYVGAYQGVKMLTIFTIALYYQAIIKRLKIKSIVYILCIAVLGSFVIFLAVKYFYPAYYVKLGDGREGNVVAYPGVLWKSCAYCAPLIITYMVANDKYKALYFVSILAAFFLLLTDASRTGFLWMALVLGAVCYVKSKKVAFFGFLIFIGITLFGVSDLDKFSLVAERFTGGYNVRWGMYQSAVHQIAHCGLLGCGFGSATGLEDGQEIVVHNAYLEAINNVGLIGSIGLLLILFVPVIIALKLKYKTKRGKLYKVGGLLCTGLIPFNFLFNPMITELDIWGGWAVMLGILSLVRQELINDRGALEILSGPGARSAYDNAEGAH